MPHTTILTQGTWLLCPDTGAFDGSAELCELYGLPPGALSSWEALVAQADEADRPSLAALHDRVPSSLTHELHGRTLHLKVQQVGTSLVGVATDLTEQQQVQLHLHALLEHTDDYVMVADGECRPVLFNAAYAQATEAAFGVPMRPGLQPHTLIPDEATHAWWEALHARVMAGERFREEYDYPFPDGSVWHFEILYCPIVEDGEITGFTEVTRNITERRAAEAREAELKQSLARSGRMESLGMLAGGVAHDLNNILGPVVAMPDLMERDLEEILAGRGGERAARNLRRGLELVSRSGRRAADAVQDLLFLGRRGRHAPQPISLCALPILVSHAETFADLLDRHPQVQLTVQVASEDIHILGEASQLDRVVRNLVGNAVEAISGPGVVLVGCTTRTLEEPLMGYEPIGPGKYAVLTVSDTGEGIPAEHLERIFEPFFSTKRRSTERGTGLGLAVVHAITKDHGGYLDVRSREGQGTVVRLYLPLLEEEVREAESPEEVPRGGERILVVDDEASQREVARRALAIVGYEVETASTAEQALELLQSRSFDLVLLDMILGNGMDGLDTLRECRALAPEQRVLLMSGHAPEKRGQEAMELGAHWLFKPFRVSELAKAVRGCLDGAPPR